MSKSKGNTVAPDEIVQRYGADTGRLFILFAAPPEKDLDWNDRAVEGCHRFLRRVWRLFEQYESLFEAAATASPSPGAGAADIKLGPGEKNLQRALHGTIKRVTVDIEERFNFNTAISAIMELVNAFYTYSNESGETDEKAKAKAAPFLKDALENLLVILAPFAPHITEELWQICGHGESIHLEQWPSYDPDILKTEEVEIVFQVNGKVRGRLLVSVDMNEEELLETARHHEKVGPYLEDKAIVKTVVIPGKLVNIVVR